MNCNREEYLVVCNLPYDVTMVFGKSGAPEKCDLHPQFRKLGSEKCLASNLDVIDWNKKQVTVRLPEHLACQGEGRYELLLHDKCCRDCDKVEIWFEADCEITSVSGQEPEEICATC